MKIYLSLLFIAALLFNTVTHAVAPGVKKFPNPIAAPNFSLSDIHGGTHKLSDYKGKVLIINFWATWCIPCKKEMPSLQRAWSILRHENVYVLGIAINETVDAVEDFLKRHPVSFPLLIDRDSVVASDWAVLGVPTAYIVDQRGRIAMRIVGGYNWDDPTLLKSIRALRF